MPPVEHVYRVVGARIAIARTRAGITQADLGSILTPPLTRAAVSNMENGGQRIMLHVMLDIANVLGVKPGTLIRKASPHAR